MKGAARMTSLTARIAPILLLSASSSLAQIGTASVEVRPPYPTTADVITLRIFGDWPNACTPRDPVLSRIGNSFRVDTTSWSGICVAMIGSFELFVPLGRVAAGYYSVVVVNTPMPSPHPSPSLIGSGAFTVLQYSATAFHTVEPCRLVDTRRPDGPTGGPALAAQSIRSFPVTGGACGIPPTAVSVSVNLTAVDAVTFGHLTLFAGDAPSPPLASNLNFVASVARAGNAVVPTALDGTGTIKVKNASTGQVHIVLDVNGSFQ